MKLEGFWADLQKEVHTRSFDQHPIYTEMAVGRLKRASIAEMMAQIKYCVTDGIPSLTLIIPQVSRSLKAELAANLYGEITGTPEVPSHWELALRAGAAAGYSKEDIDSRPMLAETKVYPDTVSAYAIRGQWVEALSFITIGIEDLFSDWCAKTSKAVRNTTDSMMLEHSTSTLMLEQTRNIVRPAGMPPSGMPRPKTRGGMCDAPHSKAETCGGICTLQLTRKERVSKRRGCTLTGDRNGASNRQNNGSYQVTQVQHQGHVSRAGARQRRLYDGASRKPGIPPRSDGV